MIEFSSLKEYLIKKEGDVVQIKKLIDDYFYYKKVNLVKTMNTYDSNCDINSFNMEL